MAHISCNKNKTENVEKIVSWVTNLRLPHTASSDLFKGENISFSEGACNLNIAGSRESKDPGLQEWVKDVMVEVLCEINRIRKDSHKFVAKTELNLFNYNQISGKAFVEYLPFAGDVAAGIPMHELEDLYQFSEEAFKNNHIPSEIGSTDLEWIECPQMYVKQRRFIIRISGDSMEPKCSIGDYVICEYHRHFQPDHIER